MKLEKKSKASFARHALKHGLALVGSPWNKTIDEVIAVIDEQGAGVIDYLNGRRDKVTGTAAHLRRHKANGKVSHLRLNKRSTVYVYGPFWLVRSEYEDGVNNTVIYV